MNDSIPLLEGYGAYMEGRDEEDNPYMPGSGCHWDWLDGYDKARIELGE
jgi:hypothetical protein